LSLSCGEHFAAVASSSPS